MDNDGIIEAETSVDAHVRQARRQRRSNEASEETPLLGDAPSPTLQDADTGVDDGFDGASATGTIWPGLKDFDGLPVYKRPSIYWMLPPFLLFALAYGGTFVPKINLITDLICNEYLQGRESADPGLGGGLPVVPGGTNSQCRIPQVSSRVSLFALARDLLGGVLAAIVTPKLGSLSDRYGRNKVIVLTTLGMLAGDVIFIIVATMPDVFSVYWLLVGYALDGLSGTFIAGMAVAHAYAADCTPPQKRNAAFGYFHVCLFTGIAAGPILAGLIVKKTDWLLSIFYIALVAHLVFICALLFVIPESLSKRRQMLARQNHAKQMALETEGSWFGRLRRFNLLAPLKILWPTNSGTSSALRRNLVLLAAIDTTMFGVAMGAMTVVLIYVNFQFGWDTLESSAFVSIVNSSRVAGLLVLLPLLDRIFRGRQSSRDPQPQRGSDMLDLVIIRVAVIFDTLGFLGYTLARSGALFVLSGVIASIGGIGSPTLQAALTKHVPSDRTGQILGATGTLHALARVVAPTLFNAIYAGTVGKFTQTVFVCLTACFAVACVFSWFLRPGVYWEDAGAPEPGVHDGEVEGEVGRY